MKKKGKYTISDFICSECGNHVPLPRLSTREKNHIKTMWCYFCKKQTDFTEIRSIDSECDVNIKVVPKSKFDDELLKLNFKGDNT